MALYNQITFILLIFEVITFVVLILPLPFTWRRALFKAIATSPIVAKIQYGLKICFIGVALLFVDAVRAMLKIENEGAIARETGARPDIRVENEFRSRKFYAQRNWYLTGFTLFLSLILSRTYSMVLDLIKAQEDLAVLQTKLNSASPEGKESQAQAQLAALQKEYDALSLKVNTQQPANKKKD